jgi:predicted RNA polymerase sigma factor
MHQDRARWDRLQIGRGLRALMRARELGGRDGFYVLQAEIVACHARANGPDDTGWSEIAGLYARLSALVASPVIELNRAVAVSMVEGPAAALAIVERTAETPALRGYHLLETVRGDLLHRLGRYTEARVAFELAASLTGNSREQDMLKRRAAEAGRAATSS